MSETFYSVVLSVLAAIVIRWCVSLSPYSGKGKPPMFGDYEAQRHWMEITYNLPVFEWYTNTTNNDLMYWGLDYPPLTAYHSWLCGFVAKKINPTWVELYKSRGLENQEHKLFMRYTGSHFHSQSQAFAKFLTMFASMDVLQKSSDEDDCVGVNEMEKKSLSPSHQLVLIADLLVYFPAVFVFCFLCLGRKSSLKKILNAAVILLYPGLITIDHGHFQYNAVSLGLALWGVIGVMCNRDLLGSVAFTLALNYKQMELYHAFPFFFYLLGKALQKISCYVAIELVHKMVMFTSFTGLPRRSVVMPRIFQIAKLGIVVIVTFVICWLPFLTGLPVILQVLHRLFPFARGLFEDKVANVWCSVSVLIKVKRIMSQSQIIKLSIWSTLAAALPSSLNVFKNPTTDRFILALVNSSLAFFLFSYQVHEKSILLAALPVCLLLHYKPFECVWFLLLSTFSMWPLLLKDDLALPYVSCMVLFYVTAYHVYSLRKTKPLAQASFILSVIGGLGLHNGSVLVQAPSQYPDLWPVIISFYCCIHFLGFFVYFNFLQFSLPYNLRPVVVKEKKP